MSCSYHSYCLTLTTPPRSRRAGDALPLPPSPPPASTSLVADTTQVHPPQSASTWLTTLQHLYPLSTLEHAFSTAFSTIDAASGSPSTSYVSSQPASLSSIFADEALLHSLFRCGRICLLNCCGYGQFTTSMFSYDIDMANPSLRPPQ
jgi:hypothetical protein